MSGHLKISNDSEVFLESFRNSTGEAIGDALLRFTLLDSSGSVFGSLENIEMPLIAGTDNNYAGVIPAGTPLVEGDDYTVVISASNYGVEWRDRFTAGRRGFGD